MTEPQPRVIYAYAQPLPNALANSGAVLSLLDALADVGLRAGVLFPGTCADADMLARTYGLRNEIERHAVHSGPGPAFYPLLALQAARRARGGVVVTRSPQIAIASAVLGQPTLLELHQPVETASRWRLWRRLLPLAKPERLSVACLTESLSDRLDPVLRDRALEVATIASGSLDFDAPWSQRDHDLGYVGSFKAGKGIEVILNTARLRPDLRMLVVGDPRGGPEIAAQLGLLENVTLTGPVSRAEIAGQTTRFHIGLAPYAATGFSGGAKTWIGSDSLSSLKIAEYMSAGAAIVSSDIPSVRAMATNGTEALLCPPGDEAAWLGAIDRLISDDLLRRRLVDAGRRRFEIEFSMAVRARRFAALIRRLAAKGARA